MRKLYSKIFLRLMTVTILLVLLTDTVFLLYFATTSIKNAESVLDTAVDNSAGELEKMNEETEQINALIQKNTDMQEALRNKPEDARGTYSQRLAINGYLFSLQKNNTNYVDSFYVLLKDGRQFKSTNFPLLYENSFEMPKFEELEERKETQWISSYTWSLAVNNRKEGYVAVTYPLYNVRTGESVGIVLEEICTETIEDQLLASCSLEHVGIQVYDKNSQLLLEEGEEYRETGGILESSADMENGWSLVFRCKIWGQIGNTMKMALLFGGILILLMISCSIILSRMLADSVAKPISQLLNTMEKEDFNQKKELIRIKTDIYEVDRLFRKYNQMVQRIKELFSELEQKQEMARKSEFAALQAQINPHFLYNTLDNITWKIRAGDTQDAVDEVMSLSRFFRLSLSKGADLVPVKNELEHVQLYLKILKKRYVKRFQYEIESFMRVADMERFFVPKLILQPLVENAVYHGFENIQENGEIHISVDWKKEEIIFEVRDNGEGMDEQQLGKINQALKENQPVMQEDSQNGYGIYNINGRIKSIFGTEYGLSYESQKGKYTIARLILPCKDRRTMER